MHWRAPLLSTIAALGLCLATRASGQAPSEPISSLVTWLGEHLANDTIPSPAWVEWCQRRRQDTTEARAIGRECESILAGRKPRDSTLVLIASGDSLEILFAAAARLSYSSTDDTGTCPWPANDVADVGFRLRVVAALIGTESAIVRVRRTCRRRPEDRMRGEYFAEVSYYLAREPAGWRIERIMMTVT